jgi:HEAT repeat protein
MEFDRFDLARLGEFKDPRLKDLFLKGLQFKYDIEIEEAAIALGKLGDPIGAKTLCELYQKTGKNLAFISGIERIGDPSLAELLIPYFEYHGVNNAYEANIVALALGELGNPIAFQPLAMEIITPRGDGSISQSCAKSIQKLKNLDLVEKSMSLLYDEKIPIERRTQFLGYISGDYTPSNIIPSGTTSIIIPDTISYHPDPRIMTLLQKCLEHPNAEIRERARRKFESLSDKSKNRA